MNIHSAVCTLKNFNVGAIQSTILRCFLSTKSIPDSATIQLAIDGQADNSTVSS